MSAARNAGRRDVSAATRSATTGDRATRSERRPRRAPDLSHAPRTQPRALHGGTTVAGDGEATRPSPGHRRGAVRRTIGSCFDRERDPGRRDRHAVDVASPPIRQRVTQPPPLRRQRRRHPSTSSSERAPTPLRAARRSQRRASTTSATITSASDPAIAVAPTAAAVAANAPAAIPAAPLAAARRRRWACWRRGKLDWNAGTSLQPLRTRLRGCRIRRGANLQRARVDSAEPCLRAPHGIPGRG